MRQPSKHRTAPAGPRARHARRILAASIVAAFGHAPVLALAQQNALPAGASVVSGTASINSSNGQMTISNSPNAILDWQSFSIGANNGVHFQQADASSKVLNRVVGNDPSSILGSLSSNGQVWLVNPNGVLFGAGARIDVGALVASTLGVRNDDFLSGRTRFGGEGVAGGSLVNRGEISTSFGGRVWLVGGAVRNEGTIGTPGGQIVLAAGESIELVDSGMPNVTVRVSAPQNGTVNLGSLLAPDGGSIDLHGAIVNQGGIVRADSIGAVDAGRVVMRARSELQLASGSITSADASGDGASGSIMLESLDGAVSAAGSVSATGDAYNRGSIWLQAGSDVTLEGARLNASGAIRIDGAASIGLANSNLASQGQGDSIVLSTAALTSTASQLVTPDGRWLVYLDRLTNVFPASQLDQLGYTFVQVGADESTTLPATGTGQHGVIVREGLDVRVHVDADRVYDGSTLATISGSRSSDLSFGLALQQPSVTYQGHFADKHAGTGKQIDYQGGAPLFGIVTSTGQSVYGARQTYVADVARAPVTVIRAVAQDKVYDGTRDAQVSATLAGLVAGDAVSFAAVGQFDTRNAGSGKTVAVTGALGGDDAANYTLAMPGSASASILHRALDIVIAAAPRKEYDATTAIDLAPGAFALNGVVAGESLVVRGPAQGQFDSRDVGSGKQVKASGVFEILGADAANYRIGATTLDGGTNRVDASATGSNGAITPATLVYNARPSLVLGGLAVDGLGGTVTGFKGNDTLANATTGTLQWQTTATPASAPGAYPIVGSGLRAANYVLVQAPGNTSALNIRAGLPLGGPQQWAQDGSTQAIASALQAALPAQPLPCSTVQARTQCLSSVPSRPD